MKILREEDIAAGQISIGFPLGLALLIAFFFFISCFLCCCLHWDKLQPFILSSTNPHARHIQQLFTSSNHRKPGFPVLMKQQNYGQSITVLMPGDEVPKFMAMACPCKPPTDEKIAIHVASPPASFCSGTLNPLC